MIKKIGIEEIIFLENLLCKDGFISFIKVNGYDIISDYADLESELLHYTLVYKQIVKKKELDLTITKFIFQLTYTYDIYKDSENFFLTSFYTMIWDIDKLPNIVEKYRLTPKKVELNKLKHFIDFQAKNNMNEGHLDYAISNESPICLIEFEPYSRLSKNEFTPKTNYNDVLLLDGYHRLYSRLNYNEKRTLNPFRKSYKNIDAYLLTPQIHMDLICNEDIRTLYKINSNLNYIRKVMIGELTKTELQNLLYKV